VETFPEAPDLTQKTWKPAKPGHRRDVTSRSRKASQTRRALITPLTPGRRFFGLLAAGKKCQPELSDLSARPNRGIETLLAFDRDPAKMFSYYIRLIGAQPRAAPPQHTQKRRVPGTPGCATRAFVVTRLEAGFCILGVVTLSLMLSALGDIG
jgi:hypothetical protein